jgi:hypothetical protein
VLVEGGDDLTSFDLLTFINQQLGNRAAHIETQVYVLFGYDFTVNGYSRITNDSGGRIDCKLLGGGRRLGAARQHQPCNER